MGKKACCADVQRIEKLHYSDMIHTHEKKRQRFSKKLSSLSQLQKDKESLLSSRCLSKGHGEDCFSLLPDDILVAILSFLTIKEAGRTSVLSCRWRYLWTFCTRLDLDYGKTCLMRKSIVMWYMNTILRKFQGAFVNELIIHFPGNSLDSSNIDSWVDFASQKGVQRFELDLTFYPYYMDDDLRGHYNFPSIERILSGWNAASEFSSLTSLSLANVNVTGKVVEHFLSKCRFLKQLAVIRSFSINYLNVSGEALRLESLQVSDCTCLRILKINKVDNLVSLRYDGTSSPLVLMNVPRLSKLTIGGEICYSLNDTSCKLFRFIQKLGCFTMRMPMEYCKGPPSVPPPRFPKLYHLKHLTLEVQWTYAKKLLHYTSLIEACPSLSRFTMLYSCEKDIPVEVDAPDFKHECLKVVELVGFEGTKTDFQLAFHLLKIAISLEKLAIVTGQFSSDNDKYRERIRKQLAVRLPTSANIVIV